MIGRLRKGVTFHAVDYGDPTVTLCFKRTLRMKRVSPIVPVTCVDCQRVLLGPRLAFCENVTASSSSPIHIRILTGFGLQPSGGADTMALCGNHVAWDIPGVVNEATMADDRTCRRCVNLVAETAKLRP
jgi:hypothetical protein